MLDLGGVRDSAEFGRRLAITAALLVVYRLGATIPLPGINAEALAQLGGAGGALERISILALGITPLVTLLILAELLKIFAPRVRRWELSDPRNRDKLNRSVVGLAVAAAAVQALGLALALEDGRHLVAEPGTPFRLACVATLVAGAAVVVWLADIITRHGLGGGVWLLLITPWLAELPRQIAGIVVSWPQFDPAISVLLLVGSVIAVLLLVGIVRLILAGSAPATAAASLWSVLLAGTVWPWALLAVAALAAAASAPLAWIGPGHPFALLVLAGLVALFAWLYLRSQRIAGDAVLPAIPPAVLAGSLAAIEAGDMLVATQLGIVPLAGHLVLIAAVALSLLARWWQPPFEPSARGPTARAEA